ncbi:nucleotidyltransferase family protein [Occultella kanbiaonis]|uniref:nucleotidyltransferase family protein n=1 Tax=Occultella kanbiaonis TaxID=2675754 RepID=UPI0013D1FEA7|nr:nucleotidyltransferase family protein [Occultella kanbiaonis]
MVDRRTKQAVSDLLVSVARGDRGLAAPGEDARPDLVQAARYHRVAPLAHLALRDRAPEDAALLRPDRDHAMGVHIRATIMLDEFGGILEDIDWVTFKGPFLSETAHPAQGLRTYHDVDTLVDPHDLREVARRLLAAGWTIADYDDMLRNPRTPGEMHWVSPSGLLMDLHWSMINMAVRRARFAVPTRELLDRRTPVALGLNRAWALSRADALVHVCLHAALTGANRLLLLVDADRLAAQIEDWDEVGRRARTWRAESHVALVLARARRVLGTTSAPADLNRRLGLSGAFGALTAVVDRVAPVPDARQEPGLARLVARAAQPSAARTVTVAGHNALLGVRERVRRAPAAPQTIRLKADEAALEIYLAGVETEATG